MARTIDLRHDIIKAANDKVRISANDTTSDFLDAKVVAGSGISIAELNDGGNEQIEISAPGSTTDEKVKVSSNDTTAGFLEDKIVGKSGKIVVTTLNDGADEDTEINIGADVFDKTTDDTDDITVGTTNKFVAQSDLDKLGNITVTQAVDLDTMESDIALNNAKRHDPVTVTDTSEIDLTLTGQDIKADLKTTGVVSGTYNNANVTVDSKGRITSITETVGSSFTVITPTINAKVVASTILYTVPAGKKFYLMELNIEPTTITGAGDGPKVSCGTNAANYDNMIALTDLKSLKVVGDMYSIDAEAIIHVASAGEVIRINNSSTASTTTYVYKAHLVGYLI